MIETLRKAKNSHPTLDDVARIACVSTATVSRCINDPRRVVPETRKRVQRAIDVLAYTPNFGGRALASRKTDTVGAIIPTMENAIFARGLQAFEEELAEAGYTLLVGSTGYDPDREYEQIKKVVARGADGLLLIGWERSAAVYEFLKMRRFPTVIAWNMRPETEFLCSGFDNQQAAFKITERVLSYGHRNVAMIAGIVAGNDRAADRLAGVRQALKDAGLRPEKMPLIEAPYTLEAGALAFARLMKRKSRPSAIICGNDVLAVGAMSMAQQLGIAVPGDVSITGFDDIDLSTVVSPQLTTVHVPHRRMGHAAAQLLVERMKGTVEPSQAVFDTEIIERGSLGPRPENRSGA